MLLDALGIGTNANGGDCVAVVGAGGKTSLCWRLVQALAAQQQHVVFTTTTKIWQPQAGVFDDVVIGEWGEGLGLGRGEWYTACVAKAQLAGGLLEPVADSLMPVVQTKLMGFSPDEVCALRRNVAQASGQSRKSVSWLIEADGARGLLLKAPSDDEPQIPHCADVVCVLACADAIGQPLSGDSAHRPNRISKITGAQMGAVLNASHIVDLLAHRDGGMKNIPPHARKVAVLTQRAPDKPNNSVPQLLKALVQRGFDVAVSVALRAEQCVLASS